MYILSIALGIKLGISTLCGTNFEPILALNQEYESWKETNEILSDPDLMKAIKEGEEDFKKGRFVTFEQLKKELKLNV